MKKALLWISVFLLSAAVLVAALVAFHPCWLGSAAASIANKSVPRILGSGFSIGELGINAFRGEVALKDFYLANPTNFTDRDAVKIGSLTLGVDPQSLQSDVIHVRDITIDDLYVAYLTEDGKSNFDSISEKFKSAPAEEEEDAPSSAAAEEGRQTRIMIDRISVSNVKVKYGMIVIPVPFTVVVTDIGKDSGGVGPIEAVTEILNQIVAAAINAGVGTKDAVLGLTAGALSAATGTVGEVKALEKSLKSVGDSFKNSFKAFRKELKKELKK